MSSSGLNLPAFRSVQLDFAAHIRNPDVYPRPEDVEPRRMQIYLDLFFNNIRNFLDSAFPVSREILGRERWLELVREFVHRHPSESPYFAQISEEFLTYLSNRGLEDLPEYLLELSHYEWVELNLDIAPNVPVPSYQEQIVLNKRLVLMPAHRLLVYEFPVHEIGPGREPASEDAGTRMLTYLVVYRGKNEEVRFVESNPVTHRLLGLAGDMNLEDALARIHAELVEGGRVIDDAALREQAMQALGRLQNHGLVVGSALDG